MRTTATNLFVGLIIFIGLGACSSNITYQATRPNSSVIEEIANAANVDGEQLKQSVYALVERGGLTALDQVSNPSEQSNRGEIG